MRRTAVAVLASMALAGAWGAQAAAAATVTLDQPCYSPGERIVATGVGFTPGGAVTETLTLLEPASNQPVGVLTGPTTTSDALGAFARKLPAPDLARKVDRREIAVSAFADSADPAGTTAFVQWTLTRWDVDIAAWDDGRASSRGSMVIDTYGWTSAASTLYAHYYRNFKRVRTVRVGALTGPCRDLRKRVRQFPFANVKAGLWTVYFSGTRVLDKRNDPLIWYRVRVSRLGL